MSIALRSEFMEPTVKRKELIQQTRTMKGIELWIIWLEGETIDEGMNQV